jgi:Permuted papain-like amidase enzyme, YaeF/YiiX, C92 family
MSLIFGWVLAMLLHPPEEREMSERLAPPDWEGKNFWGPEATKARHEGRMPPIVATQHMARWDRWGRRVLKDGDIVFRMGDARIGRGYFPMSRFLANASNSKFSHTGIVAYEEEGPVVYDTTRYAVARQPFCVWILDNVGSIGVKRLRPEYRSSIPKVLAFCRKVFEEQVPFDYELSDDDERLYCIELTEKAFRAAGIKLSEPVRLGDMERATEFPLCMFGLQFASRFMLKKPFTADKEVYFPGNERHGLWAAKQLMTVVPATYAPGYPGASAVAPNLRVTHEPSAKPGEKPPAPAPPPQSTNGPHPGT